MGQRTREYSANAKLRGECDVLVVGGGIAGLAAALAARRTGAKTVLLEKTISLGGLATLGIVVTYLPLCDGWGHQVIGGIGEELLLLSVKSSAGLQVTQRPEAMAVPDCWTRPATAEKRSEHRYRVDFNPASYMLDLEELLLNEGIELVYDTVFVDVSRHGTEVAGAFVLDKGGLGYYACGALVDATGDADVCIAAGERTISRSANVRCGWFYYAQGDTVTTARMTEPYDRNPSVLPEGSEGFACTDGASVTAQVTGSRDLMRKRLDELTRRAVRVGSPNDASMSDKLPLSAGTPADSGQALSDESPDAAHRAIPLIIPQVPTYRMTRRLAGRAEPNAESAAQPTEDTIGKTGDWRKAGPVYHIPFGALLGASPNLFATGRNISVADDLWDATRAIPACAMTGQAAGCAAALAALGEGVRNAPQYATRGRAPAAPGSGDGPLGKSDLGDRGYSRVDVGRLQSLLRSQRALLRDEWL